MARARLLVTGDTGFIGSRLMPALERSPVQVFGLRKVMPACNLLAVESQAAMLDRLQPDHVLHLAWTASSTPGYRTSGIHESWAFATRNLIAETGKRDIGITVAGSVAEVTPEDQSTYAIQRQKLWSDVAHQVNHHEIGWLRLHYVIDPMFGHPSLVSDLIRARDLVTGPTRLRNPQARHDFICVGDVVRALTRVTLSGKTGVIAVGSGQTFTVEELALALHAPYEYAESSDPESFSSRAADISRLQKLGWTPHSTIDLFSG